MGRRIVLVFGLPGVGKTTLIKSFIAKQSNWLRISGGDMILKGLSEADRDKLRDCSLEQIYQNQIHLMKNFQDEIAQRDGNILFDGHCTVRTADGETCCVPIDVIRGLSPTRIIYIDAPNEVLISRRNNDSQRPNREIETEEELNERRSLAISACKDYVSNIKIPLVILNIPNIEQFELALI